MTSKNQSRERILQTATRLFHMNGYHATGLNQIIKESGAPKGSLYYHFPDGKEQLASEAIERFGAMVAANILEDTQNEVDPLKAFQAHILKIANKFAVVENIPLCADSLPIGLMAAETALVNERLRLKCEAVFERFEEIYIEKLVASDYSKEQARLISSTLNALIEGAVTLSLTKKSNQPLQDIVKMLPLLLQK
ncbi:TetR/AcrR family transcriptional regulator [Kurthia gibsonii]|uniref:TetR/AcrR family transcriptional regulator n=1 Tax=Kurthia gibsonii TaxID=33946 RepID=A0ABU9LKG3_9BACL|nr:TetR/AcrR family transcriptional regulator [Kurthia gibsonii]RXH51822.1 TetR/AcrR family transcriptional regulator [Kurthia gibsonii]